MKVTLQQSVGALLSGYALIALASWLLFMFFTSAIDDNPVARLINQFLSSDESKHPLFTVQAVALVVTSVLLAALFFSPLAKHKSIALALFVLVVLHALGTLVVLGGAPFVYVIAICFIAFRWYRTVLDGR